MIKPDYTITRATFREAIEAGIAASDLPRDVQRKLRQLGRRAKYIGLSFGVPGKPETQCPMSRVGLFDPATGTYQAGLYEAVWAFAGVYDHKLLTVWMPGGLSRVAKVLD